MKLVTAALAAALLAISITSPAQAHIPSACSAEAGQLTFELKSWSAQQDGYPGLPETYEYQEGEGDVNWGRYERLFGFANMAEAHRKSIRGAIIALVVCIDEFKNRE